MLRLVALLVMILRYLNESLADIFGLPARLARVVEETPSIRVALNDPARSIDERASVVAWNRWFDPHSHLSRTEVRGWRKRAGDEYCGTIVDIPELSHLVTCEEEEDWCCDIRDVDGLLASKSPIERFTTMDEFAEVRCQDLIKEISEENLRKNLAHDGIRVIHSKTTSDHFAQYRWDGRVFLMNSDGSHHFAAARFIAGQLGANVLIRGKLRRLSLNPVAVGSLRSRFDIFAVKDDGVYSVLFDPFKSLEATFFTLELPPPYSGIRAVLFPRDDRQSERAAGVLRTAGFFDLGGHIGDILDHQNSM